MRHRRKKRTNDVKRNTNVIKRIWCSIKRWYKEYDDTCKELSDMGIILNPYNWNGYVSHVMEEKLKKDRDVSSGSTERGRNDND